MAWPFRCKIMSLLLFSLLFYSRPAPPHSVSSHPIPLHSTPSYFIPFQLALFGEYWPRACHPELRPVLYEAWLLLTCYHSMLFWHQWGCLIGTFSVPRPLCESWGPRCQLPLPPSWFWSCLHIYLRGPLLKCHTSIHQGDLQSPGSGEWLLSTPLSLQGPLNASFLWPLPEVVGWCHCHCAVRKGSPPH